MFRRAVTPLSFLAAAMVIILALGPSSLVQAQSPSYSPRIDRYLQDLVSGAEPMDDVVSVPEAGPLPANPDQADFMPVMPYRDAWVRFVFQGAVSGNIDVYLFDYIPHAATRLTSAAAADGMPKLAYDASKVVFTSWRDGNPEIYSMNVDGSGQTNLTQNPAVDNLADWSPDGQQVVFTSNRDGKLSLYGMNADGSNVHRLTNPGGAASLVDFGPDWSEDGKYIAFVRADSQSGLGNLMIMNPDGSGVTAVSDQLLYPERVMWSPDTRRLAFDADLDDNGWFDLGTVSPFSGNTTVKMLGRFDPQYPKDHIMGGWFNYTHLFYSTAEYSYDIVKQVWFYTGTHFYNIDAEYGSIYADGDGQFDIPNLEANNYYEDFAIPDHTIPASSIGPLPAYTRSGRLFLSVQGSDPGPASIYDYSIYYRQSLNEEWKLATLDTDNPSVPSTSILASSDGTARFDSSAIPGVPTYFASSARDLAENQEPLPNPYDATTIFYSYWLRAVFTDERGIPRQGIKVTVNPAPANGTTLTTGSDGSIDAYLAQTGSYVFLPSGGSVAELNLSQDQTVNLALSDTAADRLTNGSFEVTPVLSGWDVSGAGVDTQAEGHTGTAARLRPPCPYNAPSGSTEPCLAVPVPVTPSNLQLGTNFFTILVDSRGYVHVLTPWTYALRDPQGNWIEAEQPAPASSWLLRTMYVIMDPGDNLHILYQAANEGFYYAVKPRDGSWSTPEKTPDFVVSNDSPLSFAADDHGTFHVVYQYSSSNAFRLYDYKHELNGGWALSSRTIKLPKRVTADPQGGAYLFYEGNVLHLNPDLTDGTTTPLGGCIAGWAGEDAAGKLHILCRAEWSNAFRSYILVDADGRFVREQFLPDHELNSVLFKPDGTLAIYTLYYDLVGSGYPDSLEMLVKPAGFDSGAQSEFEYHVWYRYIYGAALDPKKGVVIVGRVNGENISWETPSAAAQEAATLSQTVTLPADMRLPTLSFFYQLESLGKLAQSGLKVTVTPEGGEAATVFESHALSGWQHAWADLSAWKGQTVKLSFTYTQAQGEPYGSALIDDVTLVPYTTPVIDPSSLPVITSWTDGSASVTVSGSNFMPGATVKLNEVAMAATQAEDGSLTFTLPAGLKAGFYDLVVINPNGRSSAPVRWGPGIHIFLTLVGR